MLYRNPMDGFSTRIGNDATSVLHASSVGLIAPLSERSARRADES